MNKHIITVFGSSAPEPGEKDYESAYLLGKLLARAGFNVCNGGYYGIMEAVSKGAREEGAEVTGVTLETFGNRPNSYVTDVIPAKSLGERVTKLIALGAGYIIYPGGTGTLLELAVVWELINKDIMHRKTVAALGGFWDDLINFMDKRMEFEKRKTGLITVCNSEEEAVNLFTSEFRF